DFKAACEAVPFTAFDMPADAMSSWDAYRSYQKAIWYPQLDDMSRIEANLRENVVIQPDRSVKDRTPKEVMDAHVGALFANKPREYTHVHAPVLAIYTQHMYDLQTTDLRLRSKARAWEQKYWIAFREKSIARVRNEITGVEIVRVPGVHGSFFLTNRERVV